MIRLQLAFILSKRSILLIMFFSLALAIITLYNSDFLSGYTVLDASRVENANNFLNNSLQVIKFLSVFISVFTFIQAFSKEAKQYASYLVTDLKSKWMYFNTKLIAIFIIVFLFVFQQMWVFYVVSRVLTPYQFNLIELIVIFGKIFLQAIFFGLFQSMLIQLLNHNFTLIFPLALYWLMEMYSSKIAVESSAIMIKINKIIPNLLVNSSSWDFYLSAEKYVLSLILMYLMCAVVHMFQDI